MTGRDDDRIQHAFRPLYGRPCWGVEQGYGSFLTFEFDAPKLKILEPREFLYIISDKLRVRTLRRSAYVHGEWHLWIYCCARAIRLNGKQLAHWELASLRIERAVGVLNGQALTKVSPGPGGRWVFDFDLGGSLLTWPYDEESEQWMLYQPSGEVLTVRADGYFKQQRSDEPADRGEWLPLHTP